jgi:hypothetical protein
LKLGALFVIPIRTRRTTHHISGIPLVVRAIASETAAA